MFLQNIGRYFKICQPLLLVNKLALWFIKPTLQTKFEQNESKIAIFGPVYKVSKNLCRTYLMDTS